MQKMLALLEEEEDDPALEEADEIQLTLQPPDNALDDVTDEDSGPEDHAVMDNLPGSQLRAPVELHLKGDFDDEEETPLQEVRSKAYLEPCSHTFQALKL